MNSAHTGSHYSRWSIGLHWLMLALIALAYAFIELRVFFERGTPERAWLRDAHTSVGLLVLGLVVVRIVARLVGTTPPITPTPPAWQRAAAGLSHGLLYAFMIGMPLLGWVMVGMRGGEASFFGLGVPLISAENKELGRLLRGWHGDIGRAVYFLIALHAAAAIYHHKRLRDDTLRRMLPALRRSPRPAPSSRPPVGP